MEQGITSLYITASKNLGELQWKFIETIGKHSELLVELRVNLGVERLQVKRNELHSLGLWVVALNNRVVSYNRVSTTKEVLGAVYNANVSVNSSNTCFLVDLLSDLALGHH